MAARDASENPTAQSFGSTQHLDGPREERAALTGSLFPSLWYRPKPRALLPAPQGMVEERRGLRQALEAVYLFSLDKTGRGSLGIPCSEHVQLLMLSC